MCFFLPPLTYFFLRLFHNIWLNSSYASACSQERKEKRQQGAHHTREWMNQWKLRYTSGKKNEKNSRSVPWNACITQKCNWKMQVTQKKQHLQLHSMQSLKQSDHFPCTFSYRANGEFEFELASNCFASSIIFDDGSGFCITLTHQIISQSIPFSSYHYDVICVYTFSCCAAALVFTSIFLLSQSMDTKITTSDTDTHVNWTTINC